MSNANEQKALSRIRAALGQATQPIVLWSSGKDSTVVLHLTLRLQAVPVMWFRLPYMQHKHAHGMWLARTWGLTVYDAMPLNVEEVAHKNWHEFIHFYGPSALSMIAMTTGLTELDEEKPYLCGVADLLNRPKVPSQDWPWDLCLQGHREADQAYFGSKQKFSSDMADLGAFKICNPIWDWNDDDVWGYIKKYKVCVDKKRYYGKDAEVSPDSYNVCKNCLDPRKAGKEVWCPKLQQNIQSVAKTPVQHESFIKELRSHVPHVRYTGEPQNVVSAHV